MHCGTERTEWACERTIDGPKISDRGKRKRPSAWEVPEQRDDGRVFLNARRRHRRAFARDSGEPGSAIEPAGDIVGLEKVLRCRFANQKGAVLELRVEGGLALLLLFALGDGGAKIAARFGTKGAGDRLAERELADVFAKHACPREYLQDIPLATGSQE